MPSTEKAQPLRAYPRGRPGSPGPEVRRLSTWLPASLRCQPSQSSWQVCVADFLTRAIRWKGWGKVLEVTGQVERVDEEGFTAKVELKTDEDGETVDREFSLDQKVELMALKP